MEMVPDTPCVFRFVSSDINMALKRSVMAGEGLRERSRTMLSNFAPYIVHASADMSVCFTASKLMDVAYKLVGTKMVQRLLHRIKTVGLDLICNHFELDACEVLMLLEGQCQIRWIKKFHDGLGDEGRVRLHRSKSGVVQVAVAHHE